MTKITYRIPLEAYAFVEVVEEVDTTTPEAVRANYEHYEGIFKNGEGLSDAEMDSMVQNFLEGKNNHIQVYEKMNKEQKKFYNTMKRAKGRINYRLGKDANYQPLK